MHGIKRSVVAIISTTAHNRVDLPKTRISSSEMFSLSGELFMCAFPPNRATRHSVDTGLYSGQAMCHALGFVLILS